MGFDDLRDGLVERRQRPAVGERDGAGRPADHGRLAAGAPGQVIGQCRHVPKGRRHDHELRLGEFHQRNLPRPAAFRFGEEVELVHHHLPGIGAAPLPQRQVGQDLGGAADDGGVGVDRGIPRDHSDPLGPERFAQGEELLVHEGLDGGGVPGAATLRQGREVGAERDQ